MPKVYYNNQEEIDKIMSELVDRIRYEYNWRNEANFSAKLEYGEALMDARKLYTWLRAIRED